MVKHRFFTQYPHPSIEIIAHLSTFEVKGSPMLHLDARLFRRDTESMDLARRVVQQKVGRCFWALCTGHRQLNLVVRVLGFRCAGQEMQYIALGQIGQFRGS